MHAAADARQTHHANLSMAGDETKADSGEVSLGHRQAELMLYRRPRNTQIARFGTPHSNRRRFEAFLGNVRG